MNRRTIHLAIVLTTLAGLGALALSAPDYLPRQGFPLDDAWIHAVYARELVRSRMLAYNPRIPATGATSPLWAVVSAVPYLLASGVRSVVFTTKLLGFLLHILSALLVYHALGARQAPSPLRLAGAVLVAFHPDLVSASVSGMEIPLATLLACAVLYAAQAGSLLSYAAVCAVAPLARPELAILGYVMPLGLFGQHDRRRLMKLLTGAVLGTTACFAALAVRNLLVSGLPLPATFYAKVGSAGRSLFESELTGFTELLGHLPIADSSILLAVLGCAAGMVVVAGQSPGLRASATALLAGLCYCAVSFALVSPVDPQAFYHQRYVLPALSLLVAPLPLLADAVIGWLVPSPHRVKTTVVFFALLAASLVIAAPRRFARLANDTHNIDDVQVMAGRSLAAAPPSDIVWAVDAGAVRYFGNAFVVDLIGLNNAALLGPGGQRFLDEHRPRYLEVVPGWSRLDDDSDHGLEKTLFKPSTPYTVTGFPPMQYHWLARCDPGKSGELSVRGRRFRFSCAP